MWSKLFYVMDMYRSQIVGANVIMENKSPITWLVRLLEVSSREMQRLTPCSSCSNTYKICVLIESS